MWILMSVPKQNAVPDTTGTYYVDVWVFHPRLRSWV
jgi:hypothetical protein